MSGFESSYFVRSRAVRSRGSDSAGTLLAVKGHALESASLVYRRQACGAQLSQARDFNNGSNAAHPV